jgi:hypothetical protein
MVLPPDKSLSPWLEWEAVSLDKQYQAMRRGDWKPSPRQFYTANASFRKRDALAAGLFDASFRRAEDVELAFRMRDRVGVTSEFLPDAVVYHEPNRTFRDWLRVPYLYGIYDVEMSRKGVSSILNALRESFYTRQSFIRWTGRLLVGRRPVLRSFIAIASTLALGCAALGLSQVCRGLYSAIFNLQYWQGFCEAVGGRDQFWQCMFGVTQRLGVDPLPESPPMV